AKPHFKSAKGKLLINAGFEDTADGLTPYRWQVYNSSGKYAGTVRWKTKGAAAGKHYARVTATNPKLPAYLIGLRFRLAAHTRLHITFKVRGNGKFRLKLLEYSRKAGRKTVLQSWQKVTDSWKKISFDYI